MKNLNSHIRKIARTDDLARRIKAPLPVADRQPIAANRGIGIQDPTSTCNIKYSLRENSYDIGLLLSGLDGPTLQEPCSFINTLTGLTDFNTSQDTNSFGATVNLVIQLDGLFK